MKYFTDTKTNINEFVYFLANTTFVLGTADPEMNCIEEGLRKVYAHCDLIENVAYATTFVDDAYKRVAPSQAYKAVHALYTNGILGSINGDGISDTKPVFVECGIVGINRNNAIVIDHHNPGDAGFDGQPEQYWESSSIGQLYRLLQSRGASPAILDTAFGKDRYYIAAADHCPTHAFKGLCPGINPYFLLQLRATQGAEFLGIATEEWLERLAIAQDLLAKLPVVETPYGKYSVATENIDFLNHASMVDGIVVEYRMFPNTKVVQTDCRTKVGLLGAEPNLIRYWMENAKNVYSDVYGCPERGYCGAYVRN